MNSNNHDDDDDDDDDNDDNDDDDYDKCRYSNQETVAHAYHVVASNWHRHSICTGNDMV